jgi:hypothetical protein
MAVLSNDFLRSHSGVSIMRTHPAAGAVVDNVVERKRSTNPIWRRPLVFGQVGR